MKMSMKMYLGDGVYANFDGIAIILTTEDGISITNSLYLEPDVWSQLVRYIERIEELGKHPSR